MANLLQLEHHVGTSTSTRSPYILYDAERMDVRLSSWRHHSHQSYQRLAAAALVSLLVIVMLVGLCSTFSRSALLPHSPPRSLSEDEKRLDSKRLKLCEGTDEESYFVTSPEPLPMGNSDDPTEPTAQSTNVKTGSVEGTSAEIESAVGDSETGTEYSGFTFSGKRLHPYSETASGSSSGAAMGQRSFTVIRHTRELTSFAAVGPYMLPDLGTDAEHEGANFLVSLQRHTAQRSAGSVHLPEGQKPREERQGQQNVVEIGVNLSGFPQAPRSGAVASHPTLATLLLESRRVEGQQAISQESEEPSTSSEPIMLSGEKRFYRLPRRRSRGAKKWCLSAQEAKSKVDGAFQVFDWYSDVHTLLSEDVLESEDEDKLFQGAEMLVAFIMHSNAANISHLSNSHFVRVMARQFLVVEMLVAAASVLEVPLQGEKWWTDVLSLLHTEEQKRFVKCSGSRGDALFSAQLANKLIDAMSILKTGERPPPRELVKIKRMLFNSSYSDRRLKKSRWNLWEGRNEASASK